MPTTLSEITSLKKKLLDSFPENRLLKLYYEKSSYPINIKTGSLIADVFIKHGSDTVWNSVGQTPIDSMRVPWFFEKHNFQLKFKIKKLLNFYIIFF